MTQEPPRAKSETDAHHIDIELSDEITSDVARKLTALGAQLSAHIAESMTPLIRDFKVDVTPFFKRMSPALEKLANAARAAMPPNWEPEGLDMETLLRRGGFIQTTGVPLVWIPDTQIVQSLETANDDEARAEILSAHEQRILEDCSRCLSEVAHPGVRFLAESTLEAVESIAAGRQRAAQARAMAAIDTGYTRLLEHKNSVLQRPSKRRWTEVRSDALDASAYRLRAKRCGLYRLVWSEDGAANEPATRRLRLR